MFKQTAWHDLSKDDRPAIGEVRCCHCPQCRRSMYSMGLDFKAPKQSDLKQWKKVQMLFEHGFAFHSCGCGGPGPRPAKLRDVKPFIADNLPKSEGKKLLEKIARKV